MNLAPGTVSKILWHFTGGPRWDSALKRQADQPKPIQEAYDALVSILRSGELRVGQYKEVVKVVIPRLRRVDHGMGKIVEELDVPKNVPSDPVCCLADIPLIHLSYHAQRYGKIAIGFHRDSVVEHGFNPVFYSLHDSEVLNAIYKGFALLGDIECNDLETDLSSADSDLGNLECVEGHSVDTSGLLGDLESSISYVNSSTRSANVSISKFMAYVKTFDRKEFGSIYTEREWRSTVPFSFNHADVAMIVLPRQLEAENYHQRFVGEAGTIPIPPTIPVIPWEDLMEH